MATFFRYAAALPLVAILFALAGVPTGLAREGDTQSLLYVGTTRFASSDATSYGTTFGGAFGYEVIDNLVWSVGASVSTTDGRAKADGKSYDIYARTTTLQTGPTYYFNRERGSLVIPYVGGGISVLNYDIDYDFPDSDLGKTSGSGGGVYALGGVELVLTRSLTFVAQYTIAAHQIRTEDGDAATLRSGGLGLSLRVGIRI